MAFLSLSLTLSPSTPMTPLVVASSSPSSSTKSFAASSSLLPPLNCFRRTLTVNLTRFRRRSWIVGMAPDEEKMTRRSPLDFPIIEMVIVLQMEEWERPKPGRRPDIFPQFSPMKTPLPPPMPADPPEEDEEEEEEKKEEEEENPEEDPDKPAQ
ncbi:hypothetical protein BUALT_Bualt07G0142200 [Buddleja alternifolia]|uniref:Uncharacterized protein n=1 Tax=Buddleja alternifolia TaxID=168488 RepID=A0AAV6XLD5_9LAMI|nr:hypothetical protein BUALT_Bualt07G0142200 [Buddleja alternifolia]